MCMLSYYPPGTMPDRTRIENGAACNPDGHGFAIVTRDKRILVERGMSAERVIDRFLDARAEYLDGPALFHSRIATSGLVDVTGCHPFRVGQDNRTVVAHNGILFNPDKESYRSDTAIFADKMLPRFGSLDKPRKLAQLEKFVGKSNKLVILTVNPQRRRNAYLVNPDMGHWVGSEWHSNYDFEGWKTVTYYVGSGKASKGKTWAKEPWPCDVCGSVGSVDTFSLICYVCWSCNDCHQHKNDCLCYYAAKAYADGTDRPAARIIEHDEPPLGVPFSGGRAIYPKDADYRIPEARRLALPPGKNVHL